VKSSGFAKESPQNVEIAEKECSAYFPDMIFVRIGLAVIATFSFAGCASYQLGNDHAGDIGSYSGSTLNSPVTDQNPHVGSDASYPASSDPGREQVPPGKTDY
jgi:hypothetical protein